MKTKSWVLVGLVLLLASAMTVNARPGGGRRGPPAAAQAQAEPQLPAAVASAISAAFPGAKVSEFEEDTDDGVAVYFVNLSTGAEVEVTSSGMIIVADYTIDMKQVPAAAAQAIQKAGAGATIESVQREEIYGEIDGGKAVKLEKPATEYLASFKKGGQTGEISVLADGTVVGPLEWGTGN